MLRSKVVGSNLLQALGRWDAEHVLDVIAEGEQRQIDATDTKGLLEVQKDLKFAESLTKAERPFKRTKQKGTL